MQHWKNTRRCLADFLRAEGSFPPPFGTIKMKKYLLISRKYREAKRGAYTTSERLVKAYPSFLHHMEDCDIKDLKLLDTQYKRLIFVTQSPNMYRLKINFLTLKNINHIMFLRNEFYPNLYNSCNNGFYYYKENRDIKYYIPFITDFSIDNDVSTLDIPCIGFYYRRFLVKDSFSLIKRFVDNLSQPVNICVMGDEPPDIENHPNISFCYYTNNNNEFFKYITHYLHLVSNDFIDPFPNTVLEAVQCNKQIIFYGNDKRKFRDGIDDLKDIVLFHNDFYPDKIYDNSKHPLRLCNFNKFYLRLFDNNFEYSFNRLRYNSFKEWIEEEIML